MNATEQGPHSGPFVAEHLLHSADQYEPSHSTEQAPPISLYARARNRPPNSALHSPPNSGPQEKQ